MGRKTTGSRGMGRLIKTLTTKVKGIKL